MHYEKAFGLLSIPVSIVSFVDKRGGKFPGATRDLNSYSWSDVFSLHDSVQVRLVNACPVA